MVALVLVTACFLCAPAVAADEAAADDSSRFELSPPNFKRLLPDSPRPPLEKWPDPHWQPEFRKRYGILPAPKNAELNDINIQIDPSIDLGMIYPRKMRSRLLLQKRFRDDQKCEPKRRNPGFKK